MIRLAVCNIFWKVGAYEWSRIILFAIIFANTETEHDIGIFKEIFFDEFLFLNIFWEFFLKILFFVIIANMIKVSSSLQNVVFCNILLRRWKYWLRIGNLNATPHSMQHNITRCLTTFYGIYFLRKQKHVVIIIFLRILFIKIYYEF